MYEHSHCLYLAISWVLVDLKLLLFRWYDKHLELCSFENDSIDRVSIVLLTNDKLNKESAQRDGLEAYTGK